jgi:hypothetical protein
MVSHNTLASPDQELEPEVSSKYPELGLMVSHSTLVSPDPAVSHSYRELEPTVNPSILDSLETGLELALRQRQELKPELYPVADSNSQPSLEHPKFPRTKSLVHLSLQPCPVPIHKHHPETPDSHLHPSLA